MECSTTSYRTLALSSTLLGGLFLAWLAPSVLAWGCVLGAASLSFCAALSAWRFYRATADDDAAAKCLIERQPWPGRAAFGANYVAKCAPALFSGYLNRPECAALRRWSPSFFATLGSGDEKGLACGRGNVEEQSGPTVKMEVQLRRLIAAWRGEDDADLLRGAYLKQFDVFRVFPQLWHDADELRRAFPSATVAQTFLWMGRGGESVTGVHNDDENNVLCQIQGRKRVLLWPPSTRALLRPNGKYDSGTECCDANPLKEDDACPAPLVALLEPGDMLFIPIYWYHHVQSIAAEMPSSVSSSVGAVDVDAAINVSLNHFVSTPLEAATVGVWREIVEWLHYAGCYRSQSCVCHSHAEPPSLRRTLGFN